MPKDLDLLQRLGLDFPTILVFFTFLTGIVWAIDSLILAKRRKKIAEESIPEGVTAEIKRESDAEAEKDDFRSQNWFVDTCRSLFPVIFAVLIIRSFIAEPFKIPSDSMVPTLVNGDFILVNKFSYGVRLPVVGTKIIDVGEPVKGDVVVFKYPKHPNIDYIKRVVAVPGDRISYINKVILINGQPIKQTLYGQIGITNRGDKVLAYEEDLAGVKHMIYRVEGDPFPADYWRPSELFGQGVVVPEGHYFVMGDNRDNSQDSRFWGFVPEELLKGKAFFIWFNWGEWNRIGSSIE